jgi:hypothetical protein
MTTKDGYEAGAEARRDLAADPERRWPHDRVIAEYLAALAYDTSHPHRRHAEANEADDDTDVEPH